MVSDLRRAGRIGLDYIVTGLGRLSRHRGMLIDGRPGSIREGRQYTCTEIHDCTYETPEVIVHVLTYIHRHAYILHAVIWICPNDPGDKSLDGLNYSVSCMVHAL